METTVSEDQLQQEQNQALLTFVVALLQRKRQIFYFALCGALLALLYGLTTKKYYLGTTIVVPPELHMTSSSSTMNQLSGMGGSMSSIASVGSLLQIKEQADALTVMLDIWPVQDAIVKKFDLVKVYHAKSLSNARKQLSLHTVAVADKGFLDISVRDSDPNRAAEMANDYVTEVRNAMKGMALTEASQRRVFYEAQMEKTKEDLSNAELNFKQMQQSTKILSVDSQARVALESAAGLRSQITATEVELNRLRSYLTESNPQVQLAETQLSALRGQLATQESSAPGGYSGTGLSNVPAESLEFVRATRELKYQESLYEIMLKQYEASRLDEARDAPVIQIISPAIPPELKAGPHRSIMTIIGFFVGLVLGFIFAAYKAWRGGLNPEASSEFERIRQAAITW